MDHLRYLRDGKRVWEAVGSDAQEALSRRHKREVILNSQKAGIEVVDPTVAGRSLEASIKQYLKEVQPRNISLEWTTRASLPAAL